MSNRIHTIQSSNPEELDQIVALGVPGLETLFTALRYGSSEPLYNMVLYFQDNLLDKSA